MIAFDFAYYQPETIEEAVQIYRVLDEQGKAPLYYGGGTEIISMARVNNIFTEAVIDIKRIPECQVLEVQGNQLVIGAGVTLTQIAEANLFPLLSKAAKRVADHTIQDKITLGGHICGSIIYREALLPLLVADAQVVIASAQGVCTCSIQEVFDRHLRLNKGDLLVNFLVDRSYTTLPYAHVKRVKQDKIDYPLVTVVALLKDNKVRLAFSGVCDFPFRDDQLEKIINQRELPLNTRLEQVLRQLPAPILNDLLGSAEYRRFVLENIIKVSLDRLEGTQHETANN